MTSEGTHATWSAQELDVERPDAAEYRELADDLRSRVDGRVAFDEYARVLYATDGSIYGAQPAGVVFPMDVADVRAAIEVATDHGVPILPRGTGSSLAGQTVGPGCVVLDVSRHMDDVLDVDPDAKRARVQPGVVQDDLDDRLAEHGLKFAPDPASSNRATVGGGIGNNSTGAHSVRYGITDAYTEAVTAVLSDGSVIEAREVVLDSPEWDELVAGDGREAELYRTVRALVEEHADEIEARYPDLKRRVSGYNLDRVVSENDDGERVLNLAKLFVGAEGTLGVVVEAELSLVTVPEETALALYCFADLTDAMRMVPVALEYDVSAVELMDDEVFRLAAESDGYAAYVEPIPDGAEAALMLEFDSELHDDFAAAVAATNERFLDEGPAFDVLEAYTESAQDDLWKLRKAAIPLLMSLPGDPKPYPFIEDATVPPEDLAEYVDQFEAILADHDTSAAYFAHAGSGTLHIRPILNLKDEAGVEAMHSITEAVTDLVLDHQGSFSGEHGDGMARTEFTPKMYGADLWTAFKEVKTAFDPEWWLHPGNVVYRESAADVGPDADRGVGADNRDHLRYGPDYQSVEPQTELDFSEDGGFAELVERCNGCGTCRQTDSDVMCPTYRASKEEVQTTRGRANMLRAAISGDLPEDEIHSERFQSEVLDLCVGCKGCKSDCPTGVDMAKLKAETKHRHHDEAGATLRERLFADIDAASKLGSALAPVSNWATELPGARKLLQSVFGIAPERELPPFRRESLQDWFETRGGAAVSPENADRRVLLFPDTYTNYSYPAAGKAAVRTLEAAGVHVTIPGDAAPSGRAAFSAGMLDRAGERARANVDQLEPRVADDWDVVFVEPSDAVMFQDEYLDLLGDASRAADGGSRAPVERVADNAYGVCEYLDTFRIDETLPVADRSPGAAGALSYHGHCNQNATNKDHHAVGVLRRVGYDVDPLDTTCCGMAGSFGYHDEHYDLSQAIGSRLFEQVEDSPADRVVAPGGSCRSQLGDRDDADEIPPHPIEAVAERLDGS
ncbi:FAD-binding and (Fe-S)-binding domain-containing protein [Halobacterium noricense]|uniref:FAD-binding and (Fe-S)-binding domain-containing protein n=1 Tax=Halobacterium noricense TaxID=223182 RepID=UPI001E44D7E5|nr:FAD-binding and (Fe-S)-binding domain-containing protein [Halobacterium noricense]UHH25002.1 FAD-binding protein [Halobacterium noricense]